MENKNKIESGDIFISLIFVGKTETIPNRTSHIKKIDFHNLTTMVFKKNLIPIFFDEE